jgi:hypothetical protein
VPAGTVQFSKLWEPNEGAGFDDIAGTQALDIEGEAITSLIGYSDAFIFFQRNKLLVLAGAGPNNYGIGSFNAPQIVMVDGATSHAGTAAVQEGVLFWGVNGPRLLTPGFRVMTVSEPVIPLSESMVPTGVRVDLSRREVVWYTAEGDALLWNYAGGNSRWARWTGLRIAGCSETALVTTDGMLLVESGDAYGDAGFTFEFAFATGNVRPEELLQGHTMFRRVGVTGEYLGPHELRIRVFYNGSPLWYEQVKWAPATDTWLATVETVEDLTPAEVDALETRDRSGQYATDKRVKRQACNFFRVEVSDCGSSTPTFIPYALSFEMGAKPGLNRNPVNTFGV